MTRRTHRPRYICIQRIEPCDLDRRIDHDVEAYLMRTKLGIPEFADSYLVEVLDEFGLAVKYVRAEGQTLTYDDGEGGRVEVLDLACGFGSLMFGHNNPDLVEHVKWLLDERTPVHAQLTGYSYGPDVAEALNVIFRRELGDDSKYYALFANSGAESVEVSIKHAEIDRGVRIAELCAGIDANVAKAVAAVRDGAQVSANVYASVGMPAVGGDGFDGVVAEVARRNAEVTRRTPLFLCLEGGFHGKLVSSVQLTYNHEFRMPFKALAAQARFVPLDAPETIKKIIDEERVTLLDLVVQHGVVDVVEREFPIFAAFYVEPVQGEAGIKPMSPELVAAVRDACDTLGCPLVADEIQSGMGRTGTFLSSAWVGLRPDYVILAKSLGGGIVKIGAVLIHESRYRKDFELMHTTTFGKDGLSCRVAHKVVQMLEAEDGRAYRLAEEIGEKSKQMMLAVQRDFPEIVKEVRGKGLMLGFEFFGQGESKSEQIREWWNSEALAYVVWGHLLRKHRIRILSTASNLDTLRFEPSIFLTPAELDQFEAALRDVCSILRDGDASRFVLA
jgi:acetylornithine/succinyldiaminopimelate/putrescine aminotransferase